MNLDLDQGVTKRRHPSGFVVAMYKRQPGRFYDIKGQEVGASVAREAGFDTQTLMREKEKNDKLAQVKAEIESQFQDRVQEAEEILNNQAAGTSYKVQHIGSGKYGIVDGDDNRLTKRPMTKQEAENFLETLRVEDGRDSSEADGSKQEGSDAAA